jgi:hypothetical protein
VTGKQRSRKEKKQEKQRSRQAGKAKSRKAGKHRTSNPKVIPKSAAKKYQK